MYETGFAVMEVSESVIRYDTGQWNDGVQERKLTPRTPLSIGSVVLGSAGC